MLTQVCREQHSFGHLCCRREAHTKHQSIPELTSSFPVQPRIGTGTSTSTTSPSTQAPPALHAGTQTSQTRGSSSICQAATSSGSLTGRASNTAPSRPLTWDTCPDPHLRVTQAPKAAGPPWHVSRDCGSCLTPACKELNPRSVDISKQLPKLAEPGSALIGCVPAGSN